VWLLVFLLSMRRLLVVASVVPSSPILVTLMKEALSSSETSVLTRATRRNIPEDAILFKHNAQNHWIFYVDNIYISLRIILDFGHILDVETIIQIIRITGVWTWSLEA
jgi:hypothetical protein